MRPARKRAAEAGVDAAWGAGLVDAIITASRAQIV